MEREQHSSLIIEVVLEKPSPVLQNLHEKLAPIMEGEGRIEVVICDPGMMRMLNRRFRMLDKPTDVLTFDLSDSGDPPEGTIFVDGRLAPPPLGAGGTHHPRLAPSPRLQSSHT